VERKIRPLFEPVSKKSGAARKKTLMAWEIAPDLVGDPGGPLKLKKRKTAEMFKGKKNLEAKSSPPAGYRGRKKRDFPSS